MKNKTQALRQEWLIPCWLNRWLEVAKYGPRPGNRRFLPSRQPWLWPCHFGGKLLRAEFQGMCWNVSCNGNFKISQGFAGGARPGFNQQASGLCFSDIIKELAKLTKWGSLCLSPSLLLNFICTYIFRQHLDAAGLGYESNKLKPWHHTIVAHNPGLEKKRLEAENLSLDIVFVQFSEYTLSINGADMKILCMPPTPWNAVAEEGGAGVSSAGGVSSVARKCGCCTCICPIYL